VSADLPPSQPDDLSPDESLARLGLELPPIPRLPGGNQPRISSVRVHGGLAYLSGVGPIGTTGRIGEDMTIEEGYAAARTTALLSMRRIVDALGSLDTVDRWLKVLGFIRSAPGFGQQALVLNGFSDLVIEVYGEERGRCARSAIGASELPHNIPVEVEAVVALQSDRP
jgi:enamine deaminase RidA (YjgF/YER057c/UK114 family)